MIRFFQQDTKVMKVIFWVIIVVSCAAMVIFLVPGLFSGQTAASDTYASIGHGGFLGRFLPAEQTVSTADVRNLADSTEVQIVAYPLDASQRPQPNAPTLGRFIVALPGYVEPLDFPAGRFVTLRGKVAGSRTLPIDEHELVLPLVADATMHLWPPNFPYEEPRVHFSFGVGVGVH